MYFSRSQGIRGANLLVLWLSGCTGYVEVPSGSLSPTQEHESAHDIGQPIPACNTRTLASQPLRRLSSAQYANTIADLFGPTLAPRLQAATLFPATVIKAGFSADAEANVVSSSESQAIENNAEQIARIVATDPQPFLHALLPCAPKGTVLDANIDGCIDAFIESFATRCYRRPVTETEQATVRALFDVVRETQSATSAFVATVQLLVQSPGLLYRVERGMAAASPGVLQLSDHELASRLSFLLTDSMPDAALFEAADRGELRTRGQVIAHADRLMESPRFVDTVAAFHRDWLHLYDLALTGKNAALFPEYTPELAASLKRESTEYVRYVFERGDGSLRSLLGGTTFPLDERLAALYGVTTGQGDAFVPVELPDRRGLLTLASFMAATSKSDHTVPIHRGAFFQREVLCKTLPGLPGNVDTSTPLKSSAALPTARERYAPLLEDEPCASCHKIFNPTGLAFEQFDALGRRRTHENGEPIDASGSVDLGEGAQDFSSAVELIDLVLDSPTAENCYSLQWYRAALGRLDVPEDGCVLESVQRAMQEGHGDIRTLLRAVIRSDVFFFLRADRE